MNKNMLKLIGGGLLLVTTIIIGAVNKKEEKDEKERMYADGYFKVVDIIIETTLIPIFAKSELIKVIPQYQENCFYNSIISIINSDMPNKLKFDTIMGMCGK